MLSNALFVAQTTVPTGPMSTSASTPGLLIALFAVAAGISANVITTRKLYRMPELPPPVSRSVFAGLLLAAVSAFLSLMVLAGLMGANPGTDAGKRLAVMFTPLVQVGAFAFTMALLWRTGWFTQVWSWGPRLSARKLLAVAVGGYLLTIPWVLLCDVVLELLARQLQVSIPSEHVIFDLWRHEGAGVSLFKTAAFLSAVVGAPLIEELVFRGLLQRLLVRLLKSPAVAIVLTSLAFAAIHQPWPLRPPIFVLSLALGWVYFRRGNLALPMLIHAIFNLLQFGLFMLMGDQ
jgi:membrane protease YdiL (CAAX protease family)